MPQEGEVSPLFLQLVIAQLVEIPATLQEAMSSTPEGPTLKVLK